MEKVRKEQWGEGLVCLRSDREAAIPKT